MEIVLQRWRDKKHTQKPGTSSAPWRKLLWPPSAGAGPGAAPLRPGLLRLPSSAGLRLPARAAAAEQPADRASPPRRAAGSGSASERARSHQPARAASGAVSQPRSWNLKKQTRLGVWGPWPREEHAGQPGLGRSSMERACPVRKVSYLQAGLSLVSGTQNTSFKESVREIPPPHPLEIMGGGGSDLYAQQVIPLFSVALVSVLVHRLSSMKAHRQMGITVSRDAGVWREGGGWKIQLLNTLKTLFFSLPLSTKEASPFLFPPSLEEQAWRCIPASSPASSDTSPSRRRHLLSKAMNGGCFLGWE